MRQFSVLISSERSNMSTKTITLALFTGFILCNHAWAQVDAPAAQSQYQECVGECEANCDVPDCQDKCHEACKHFLEPGGESLREIPAPVPVSNRSYRECVDECEANCTVPNCQDLCHEACEHHLPVGGLRTTPSGGGTVIVSSQCCPAQPTIFMGQATCASIATPCYSQRCYSSCLPRVVRRCRPRRAWFRRCR